VRSLSEKRDLSVANVARRAPVIVAALRRQSTKREKRLTDARLSIEKRRQRA
jgi:hypothetical protein